MRLTYAALIIAAALVTIIDGTDTAAAETESTLKEHASTKKTSESSELTADALEERATSRRSGSGYNRNQIYGMHTSIGMMYPNKTPYLNEKLRQYLQRMMKKKATTTRRLRA
ncbi:hypothetical protein F441_02786 [Phytophthora nicotianae CJ01A1]|uniref:RxLR effector protein n=6 Tax=Phytophthora nicotianae TaxID=4792 RepID=W2QPK1_PHYN3|nr:hypothetical protein PPTG_07479 [Phytophthora nicotianae INRA-310]ETI54379.1 hypothetical protein F443_02797 [Phytophthora nicotianae P1569]ETK94217.1 hypothetical protein L915_02687 [Phytophthora nicotianae]ETO83116.1 hypothetical protein F444_02811 [Phytophthora nicotianae P1976]ETP24179.1 hypothetical protein F441_02786 [Phytophthora nicotianae CJ01A1]ETP52170.1 hypothetical protein F442_02781 [Phytophthora nicotianae P10297]